MWKNVSRRLRDTFERSVGFFDKRGTTGLTTAPNNSNETKNPPCRWFVGGRCWDSFMKDNNTNSRRWNFEHLNHSWLGAITWSSALVLGWYATQLIHLKQKYRPKSPNNQHHCILFSLQPYLRCVNKDALYSETVPKIEKIIGTFTPTVHSVSNNSDTSSSSGESKVSQESADNDLGNVLNSIENKLGLAAIENGHHQEGLNLLRSAANRNHPPALYNLGLCYEMGLGVPTDEKMAMELYRSAATLEHPGAMYNLGIYYGQGRGGLNKDVITATRLLRLAAVKGQEDAVIALKSLDIDAKEPAVPTLKLQITLMGLYHMPKVNYFSHILVSLMRVPFTKYVIVVVLFISCTK